MLSVLPSLVVLGAAVLAAAAVARGRWSPPERAAERRAAGWALAIAVAVQSAHFAEEAAFGLPERLGELAGLPGMPFSLFVTFNVVWLGIWIVSVLGLRSGHPAAFFAAWFLAIAGAINGIVHPLLAMATRGYFPGLLTAPFIGVASVWLWVCLHRATRPRPA